VAHLYQTASGGSLGGLLENDFIEGEVGDARPGLAVLAIEFLQALGLRGGHPAELLPPPDCPFAGDLAGPYWEGNPVRTTAPTRVGGPGRLLSGPRRQQLAWDDSSRHRNEWTPLLYLRGWY